VEFTTVSLKLTDFFCSYRGQPCDARLDVSQIQSFGWQAPGGVYESFSQSGVGVLEIDWVALE
jgi:hypothetical protein